MISNNNSQQLRFPIFTRQLVLNLGPSSQSSDHLKKPTVSAVSPSILEKKNFMNISFEKKY